MAYEYNPQSATFDLPNPHRIENIFLGLCATVCLAAALYLLFTARGLFDRHDLVHFTKCIAFALTLLALSVAYALQLMRQMRFFFGRGQPADLVPSLRPDEFGFHAANGGSRQIADAAALRQTLQQNAISYRVPRGPVENLLYSLVRDLVYSPRLTQLRVQSQFRNVLGLGLVIILLPVSLAGIGKGAAREWIGYFYFALTAAVMLRPFAAGQIAAARFSSRTVIAFVALAIVGPVVLASIVPAASYPFGGAIDIISVTFVALCCALIVSALVLKAGTSNTVKPSQIAIAPHLETPSVNITPAQIYTELARELQRLWVEEVPNRAYMRILPDVSERQGTFRADVIEERQPLPVDAQPLTLSRSLALPATRWLLAVDLVCTMFSVAGAVMLASGALAAAAYTGALIGGVLLVVGAFGIRSANEFWRRFDFTSRIYWVDWNGAYSRGATKLGGLLTDRVQAERDVISVEAMTLRVWVADIDSVAFNTDIDRDLVAIRGLPDEAERLGRQLADFAANSGSVTAPLSSTDRERIDAMNSVNRSASGPPGALEGVPPVTKLLADGRPARNGRVFCTNCGAQAAADNAAFCHACGARLA